MLCHHGDTALGGRVCPVRGFLQLDARLGRIHYSNAAYAWHVPNCFKVEALELASHYRTLNQCGIEHAGHANIHAIYRAAVNDGPDMQPRRMPLAQQRPLAGWLRQWLLRKPNPGGLGTYLAEWNLPSGSRCRTESLARTRPHLQHSGNECRVVTSRSERGPHARLLEIQIAFTGITPERDRLRANLCRITLQLFGNQHGKLCHAAGAGFRTGNANRDRVIGPDDDPRCQLGLRGLGRAAIPRAREYRQGHAASQRARRNDEVATREDGSSHDVSPECRPPRKVAAAL